jgi:hypothetical protein
MADKFNAKLSVSDLDFDTIKRNLKAFLSSQEQFKDMNFEGSGLNILLDLLAYNTHYQGFYTNMVANEMFLDSATRRDSVVSIAKHLGYTPNSVTAPTATVDIYDPSANLTDNIIAGSTVRGAQGGKSFGFSVMETSGYTLDSDGLTAALNVEIKEGNLETISYIFTDKNPNIKYKIPKTADISTLTVRVQTSADDSTGYTDKWTLATDLNSIEKTDKAYHIQEIEKGEFEIYFGDNIVGKKPDNNNILIFRYLNTKGTLANGVGNSDKENARVFTYSSGTVKVVSASSGGADAESIKSIKYYAPKTYQAQDRSVTAKDYEALLLKDYPDIESVYVWGGQDNDPPEYGKVFISIKPKSGLTIDATKKENIKRDILKKKNIVSVTPELLDPDFIYLLVESNIVYDNVKTILDKKTLKSLVKNTITDYVDNDLEKFDRDLYFSKLTKLMDEASDSIVGNDTHIKLQKRFVPALNVTANYKVKFGNPIYHPHDGHMPIILSTAFKYKDDDNIVFEGYFEDDGWGKIQLFKYSSLGKKVLVYYGTNSMGTVNYTTGEIDINNFRPISFIGDSNIRINCKPANKNIFAKQSAILTIDKTDAEAVILTVEDKATSNRHGTSGISSIY